MSISHNDITFGKPIVKMIRSNCRSTPISGGFLEADKVHSFQMLVRPARMLVKMARAGTDGAADGRAGHDGRRASRFRAPTEETMQPMMKTTLMAVRAIVTMMALVAGTLIAGTSGAQAQSQNSSQYTMQEIVDAGHGFFGETSGALPRSSSAPSSATACRTAISSARKDPVPSSPASPMARASSIPRMWGSTASSGRARHSGSTGAARAAAP